MKYRKQSQQMNKTEKPVYAVKARPPKHEPVHNNVCCRCGNVHDKCPAIGQFCKKVWQEGSLCQEVLNLSHNQGDKNAECQVNIEPNKRAQRALERSPETEDF